jgi:hypothetical protein
MSFARPVLLSPFITLLVAATIILVTAGFSGPSSAYAFAAEYEPSQPNPSSSLVSTFGQPDASHRFKLAQTCAPGWGICPSGRCAPLGSSCCANGAYCPAGSQCCGNGCCLSGSTCYEGQYCIPNGVNYCGSGKWCSPSQYCVDGGCRPIGDRCSGGRVCGVGSSCCGQGCCAAGSTCREGQYCIPNTAKYCGSGKWCSVNQYCAVDGCRTIGDQCDGNRVCDVGLTCCGDHCCRTGTTCRDGQYCVPARVNYCGAGRWCQTNQTCTPTGCMNAAAPPAFPVDSSPPPPRLPPTTAPPTSQSTDEPSGKSISSLVPKGPYSTVFAVGMAAVVFLVGLGIVKSVPPQSVAARIIVGILVAIASSVALHFLGIKDELTIISIAIAGGVVVFAVSVFF